MAVFSNGVDNQQTNYSGLNVSSSKMDAPVTIFWGMRRLTTNAIWFGNFRKEPVGGKKAGGKAGGQYNYFAAVIVALCEGIVDLIQNIWPNGSTTTVAHLSTLGLTFFNGASTGASPPSNASPWSYTSSQFPTQARTYRQTAYLASPSMNLGPQAQIQDNQFECQRLMSFSYTHTTPGYINPTTHVQSNGIDVLVTDCLVDLLTNTQYGMNFGSGDIGDQTQLATYLRAQGIFVSPLLDTTDKANSVIDRLAMISNAWIYWNGTQLISYPLADGSITGNGVTFVPDNDVAYDLGPSDFLGDIPLKVNRPDAADAFNRTRLNICDRTLGYISNPIEYKDQTLVDDFGLRDNSGVDGRDICDPIVGRIVVQLIGKRAAYVRNTYQFKGSWRLIRCVPGTVLTLNDPNQALSQVRVRVRTVSEAKDDTLDFLCEEFPGTAATYTETDPGGNHQGNFPDQNIDPGPVNTPCIAEPNSAFTQGKAVLLIAASGANSNWGGCQINVSFDNGTTFFEIGQIGAQAAQGLLTANLPSHSDPDNTNTLAVDCTESFTILPAVTHADADQGRTLSLVCAQPTLVSGVEVLPTNGELLAYGNVVTVGTFGADLTYLRRGQYGSTPSAHSTGDQFTLLDVSGVTGNTFDYQLPPQYIGKPLIFKFVSFNLFGLGLEDISTVTEYGYTPTGAGYGSGSGGVPATPTGLAGSPGNGQNVLTWNANPPTDNVTAYTLYAAPGLSQPFSSAVEIYSGISTAFQHSGIGNNASYTYFLTATNVVGTSPNTAGVNCTSNASGIGTVSSITESTGIVLTPNPITSTGTVGLAPIADGDLLANTSGSSAAPVPTSLSALIDHVQGSAAGDILYRSSGSWVALSPGTNGYVLTLSAGLPTWAPSGSGSSSLIIEWNGATIESGALSLNFSGALWHSVSTSSHNVTIVALGMCPLVNGDLNHPIGTSSCDTFPGFVLTADNQCIGVPL